jgi:hypothetical protein
MQFIVEVSARCMKDQVVTPRGLASDICDLLSTTVGGPISVRLRKPKRKTKLKKGTRK